LSFLDRGGRAFLTHRLRRLAGRFAEGARLWFPEIGIQVPPRSVAALLFLLERPGCGVAEISAETGVSHPLMVRLVRTLEAEGLVRQCGHPTDGRRRAVFLTDAGKGQAKRLAQANLRIAEAHRQLAEEAGIDLLEAVARIEALLADRSFADRLRAADHAPREQVG
jgi:DNA-binding MarR family transcriptional regulator